jgi:peptidyl-prolyl cis-trans isomerase C
MRHTPRLWLVALVLALPWTAAAQTPQTSPPGTASASPIAATVNGQPITEAAVQRGLERVPPARRTEKRKEVLDVLIDNALVDQFLLQLQIAADPKEVEKRVGEMKTELTKQKKDFDKLLQELKLTEAELRTYIAADLRWEKYAAAQANDKAVRELFEANRDMFDGTIVRARHILLTPAAGDAKAAEAARAQLLRFKQQIEEQVAAGLAKLPPGTDNLAREKARVTLTEEAFGALAKAHSACPSKDDGGDVGWFQRAGIMVEPFAKAAFALKPYQMSDVVHTSFGYHLILVTDRKPGREIKFEDVKDEVKEVFIERLRDAVAAQRRPKAEIKIAPVSKP